MSIRADNLGNNYSDSFKKVKMAFHHVQTEVFPKGELWLSSDILKKAGFEDNLIGHLKLIDKLKHDLICLPTALEPFMNKSLGYWYFPVNAIQEALEVTDLFVMAVIDGPFQRLVEESGLIETLTGWAVNRGDFLQAYEKERTRVEELIRRSLDCRVHGIVIADDLAGEASPYLKPQHIEQISSSFYTRSVSLIHSADAVALFHSCGRIYTIIPQILSCDFDGLASVQHRTNDLVSLNRQYGERLTLMGGIDGELLQKEEISSSDVEALKVLAHSISGNGGFILSSSCGLYSGEFLERIQTLYACI